MADSSPDRRGTEAAQRAGSAAHLFAATRQQPFEGHVDVYGHHAKAGGWFVIGWISHHPDRMALVLADQAMLPASTIVFHPRPDLGHRGVGFVCFAQQEAASATSLLAAMVDVGGEGWAVHAAEALAVSTQADLTARVTKALTEAGSDAQSRRLLELLQRRDAEPAAGHIEAYGYHDAAEGWFVCGWTTQPWPDDSRPQSIRLLLGEREASGDGYAVLYPRGDIAGRGVGFAIFVRAADAAEPLASVHLTLLAGERILRSSSMTNRLPPAQLLARLQPILAAAQPGPQRDVLQTLVRRDASYRAEPILHHNGPSRLEIDLALQCGPSGLVLSGWCAVPDSAIRDLRVLHGSRSSSIDLTRCIRIDRPDVVEALNQQGAGQIRCGFVAWVPDAIDPDRSVVDEKPVLEVELEGGRTSRRTISPAAPGGLAAIRQLLSIVDLPNGEVLSGFNNVLGPAAAALNAARLHVRTDFETIHYGTPPAKPRYSVIIPLHRRLDFVEYQLALFSAHPHYAQAEFIYVLDDPPLRREAQQSFPSIFTRFGLPFTTLLLEQNIGYAPANNIGLAAARGEHVVFLNSDVFPDTADWLQRLARRRTALPDTGIIGPLLVFQDGSIQHRGMSFRFDQEFNLYLNHHIDKGRRPSPELDVAFHPAVTAACLMMPRALATRVGGFDEGYILGDFEDSDLCLRVQELGYRCAVDPTVRMFHLERQSQGASSQTWRRNLTLYNAWRHQARWGETIRQRWATA
ncbi:MAG: glycosyltransferase [Proteobacteria bacterium]|nr:glycosyltransferase [Pseudomonadota bacterium]